MAHIKLRVETCLRPAHCSCSSGHRVKHACQTGRYCRFCEIHLQNCSVEACQACDIVPVSFTEAVPTCLQMPDDSSQQMREQLLHENQLNLHTHYLSHGSHAPSLLAALRLAVGDSQYLNQVAQKRVAPNQVLASRRHACLLLPALPVPFFGPVVPCWYCWQSADRQRLEAICMCRRAHLN